MRQSKRSNVGILQNAKPSGPSLCYRSSPCGRSSRVFTNERNTGPILYFTKSLNRVDTRRNKKVTTGPICDVRIVKYLTRTSRVSNRSPKEGSSAASCLPERGSALNSGENHGEIPRKRYKRVARSRRPSCLLRFHGRNKDLPYPHSLTSTDLYCSVVCTRCRCDDLPRRIRNMSPADGPLARSRGTALARGTVSQAIIVRKTHSPRKNKPTQSPTTPMDAAAYVVLRRSPYSATST
ncbi:unnamed protein product [Trichogramma brassicae]|uniref:Uncharacterized protein n=1 Tax=Trichogramma brassicae TaxID=86971 RepID=A0A6H5HYS7_9HYME|nr:unnamed protein product [Trichogramma brassicae]